MFCCGNDKCCSSTESTPIPVTDSMGREIFWEDIGRPDGIISK